MNNYFCFICMRSLPQYVLVQVKHNETSINETSIYVYCVLLKGINCYLQCINKLQFCTFIIWGSYKEYVICYSTLFLYEPTNNWIFIEQSETT